VNRACWVSHFTESGAGWAGITPRLRLQRLRIALGSQPFANVVLTVSVPT
jgi:hypothetical protein